MKALWVAVSMCLAVCAVGGSSSHGAEATDAIPESASAVVRWKAPQTSVAKLADFVDAVQPGLGGAVKAGLPGAGELLGNPGLKGVDLTQDIWLIAFAEPQATPAVVVVMTAKDVDDIKDSLADSFELHAVGKLVAYSIDEDALEQVKQRLGGEGKSLLAKLDASSKKLFDSSDLGVLVNIKQLVEDFSDELEQAGPQLDALIDQITENLPEAQRPQLEPAFEMYRNFGKMLLKGIHDTPSFVLGVTFSKTAIRIEDRIQIAEGTPTSKFFTSQKPGEISLLSKLPAGKPAYFAIKGELSSLIQWSLNMSKNMLTDASTDQKKLMDDAVKEFANIKYDEIALYFDVAPKAPAVRMGAVATVNSTKGLREFSQKFAKAMGEIKTPMFTQTTVLESNVDKIGGVAVDRLTIKQKFDDSNPGAEIQQKVMSAMFGDDGMQQFVLYQPTRMLQTTGGGKAELQNLATAVDSTKGGDAAAAAARKRFPEKANVIALFDLARIIQNGVQVADELDAPVNTEGLADLKLEPSFIGYALGCDATSLQSQFELPVVQVQNIAKLIGIVSQPK